MEQGLSEERKGQASRCPGPGQAWRHCGVSVDHADGGPGRPRAEPAETGANLRGAGETFRASPVHPARSSPCEARAGAFGALRTRPSQHAGVCAGWVCDLGVWTRRDTTHRVS